MDDAATLNAHGRRQPIADIAMVAAENPEHVAMPTSADALCDLAITRHRNGDPEHAVEACLAALTLDPDHGAASLNLSCILRELDRLDEAILHADRAETIGLAGGDHELASDARFNRSLARLGLGQIADGWSDWDARLSQPIWRRFDLAKRWNGEKLAGRQLVVRREQGIGDELFFASCYRELLKRTSGADGGAVVIECDARLQGPLSRALPAAKLHGIDTIAGRGAAMAGRPTPPSAARAAAGDLWVAAGSLPGLLGQPMNPPPQSPILAPLPELVARWRHRLADLPGTGPVVGLCWRSSMLGARRDRLQAEVTELAPILRLADIRPVSLQIGPRPEELQEMAAIAGRPIEPFADLDLANDFEQALALAGTIDLVVSVGTWIVPLAGATGTPAWYLQPLRDYWTMGTETIPWFANTRCYDARNGDFQAAAARAAGDIARGDWR